MKIKKVAVWLFFNGLLAVSLYFGLVENIEGAKNVGVFLAWLTGLMSLGMLHEPSQDAVVAKGKPMPVPVDVAFDVSIICLLVWFGFWWTGAMYTIGAIAMHSGYALGLERAKAKKP